MLTIEECRKYLDPLELTDAEVKILRDSLYSINEAVISQYFEFD